MDKEIFRGAWSAFRSRPLVWLIVSAASVPYVFSLFEGGPPVVLTYMLMFLFWCMAAYAYGAEKEFGTRAMLSEGREAMAYHWMKFLNLSIMAGAGFFVIMNLVPMLLYTVLVMVNPPGNITTSILIQYITYVLVAMPVTLFALAPQLAILRHDFEDETDRATGVFKTSYLFIKDRYKRALPLFILPELAARTVMFPFTLVLIYTYSLATWYGIAVVILMLLVLSLIEGAKTAYIAAAFNLFLDQIEAEEKVTKKKQPAKGAAQQKKTEARKPEAKKPGPSPHKKKK